MSPRTFLGWSIAAVAALAAAFAVHGGRPGAATVAAEGEPVFADLQTRPEELARIEIRTAEGAVDLVRGSAGWTVANRHGYPADPERVRALVLDLAGLDLLEPKTADAERYGRLQIQDLDRPGSQAKLVRLLDAEGGVLAEALIGKASGFVRGTESGTYLRRAKETQSWLVKGSVTVDVAPPDWLDRAVVDLPTADIRAVTVTPADAEAYELARATPADPVVLAALPEGRTSDQAAIDEVAGALAALTFEDVRPAADIAWPDQPHSVTLTTFDGLSVTAEIATIDGADWVRFTARGADAAAARADELEARLGPWAYALPARLLERLKTPRDDLLAEPEPSS